MCCQKEEQGHSEAPPCLGPGIQNFLYGRVKIAVINPGWVCGGLWLCLFLSASERPPQPNLVIRAGFCSLSLGVWVSLRSLALSWSPSTGICILLSFCFEQMGEQRAAESFQDWCWWLDCSFRLALKAPECERGRVEQL